MKRHLFQPLLVLIALTSCEALAGTVDVFNSRASWDAAVGNAVNLDFEPINAANTVGGLYVAGTTGFTLLGVGPIQLGQLTFTGVGQNSATGVVNVNYLVVMAPNFPGPHCLGGDTCLQGGKLGNIS